MYELYSWRIKNRKGEPEIFTYDSFSSLFRKQLFYIVADVYDLLEKSYSRESWKYLHDSFARELGVKQLSRFYDGYELEKKRVEGFISEATEVEIIDFIDFTFTVIYNLMKLPELKIKKDIIGHFEKAIKELNHRFKQYNLGYEFLNGEIIRKDSELLHQEIVKPTLRFLLTAGFTGPEQEFVAAFEHRRKGENKEALLHALQAFENTLKAICTELGYTFEINESSARGLMAVLERNDFYPADLNTQMDALRSSLESGLANLVNKNAGQSSLVTNVSDDFAEYALNLAATNILFLTKLYVQKKSDNK